MLGIIANGLCLAGRVGRGPVRVAVGVDHVGAFLDPAAAAVAVLVAVAGVVTTAALLQADVLHR